jgi:hypothetical protein
MKKLTLILLALLLASCTPKVDPVKVVAPVAEVVPAGPATVVTVAPAVGEPKLLGVHTVVSKDTLWFISGKWYKDPVLWPSIYEINKDQIKDPDLIYAGQKFDIPMLKADGKLSAEDNTLLQQGYLEAYRVYKEKGKKDAEDYKTEANNYK